MKIKLSQAIKLIEAKTNKKVLLKESNDFVAYFKGVRITMPKVYKNWDKKTSEDISQKLYEEFGKLADSLKKRFEKEGLQIDALMINTSQKK